MQGVNLGTVKSRLVRGRACLKALLTAAHAGLPAQSAVGDRMSLREEAR